ncbi:MAG: sigma 54-interacting transcriptional regulator, partial [Deltaproteobacteria bacterium]|nr:sigma 54-interacting transcriptional regulator [Deltaproteobacteria bacterium]
GKLLRALENREIARVGETQRRAVDVRVVAATNRDLAQMMADGELLEDLYYRIGGIEIELPALRHRGRANLEHLANVFLEHCLQRDQRAVRLSPAAYEAMVEYAWPGNVRELLRVIQRATFWAQGDRIDPEHLRLPVTGRRTVSIVDDLFTMPYKDARAEFDAMFLRQLWPDVDGKVTEAARQMGVDRRTIAKLADRIGLRDKDKTS